MKKTIYHILSWIAIMLGTCLNSCQREPMLHLHEGGADITIDVPVVDLDLQVIWDYNLSYDVSYDWKAEWLYGWDDTDRELFGELGYSKPDMFNIRRYFTQRVQYGHHGEPYKHLITGYQLSANYDFGFWDILAWNEIQTPDGIQSIHIDETQSYDSVIAYTNPGMVSARYDKGYTRAFYQPEELFAGYESGIEINENLDGFEFDPERNRWVKHLNTKLQPVTYLYLLQVILHNNNQGGSRKITAIDGNANLSGMARTVTLNTGLTGSDAITVNTNMRMKKDQMGKNNEVIDIIGGKVYTFGIPKLNPSSLSTRAYKESLSQVKDADLGNRHYLDVSVQFYNGMDSTFVFDVTDQVRKLYRGGVITVELDMNKVPVPTRPGGSGFDAVVKDFEEKEWEFDM